VALNKAQTSVGVKVVLVILIVVFVGSFVSIGTGLFSGTGQQNTGTTGTDSLATINAQYQPAVAALTSQLQSEPESYTALVSLGNTYFDWALKVQEASRTTTTAVGADQPLWVSAKDAYERAVEVKDDESPVRVDYAITLFYTGETNVAISTAEKVTKDDPDFAPAWFNLGVFYQAAGENEKAIAAYERAVELDPEGTQIGLDYANQQLQTLRSGNATQTP
jgi:tetratricopeptide (TPR) repeat protein